MSSSMLRCPHCNDAAMVVPSLPGDVMAVVACQSCGQWSVLFRGRAMPINREVLEGGTLEERQRHLAEIISHFLATGLFAKELSGFMEGLRMETAAPKDTAANTAPDPSAPITQEECAQFADIDLPLLDDAQAFRRIFG